MSILTEHDIIVLYQLHLPVSKRDKDWNQRIVYYVAEEILVPFLRRSMMASWGAGIQFFPKIKIPIPLKLVEREILTGIPVHKYVFNLVDAPRLRCNVYSSDIRNNIFDNYEECAEECIDDYNFKWSPFPSTYSNFERWKVSWQYYRKLMFNNNPVEVPI